MNVLAADRVLVNAMSYCSRLFGPDEIASPVAWKGEAAESLRSDSRNLPERAAERLDHRGDVWIGRIQREHAARPHDEPGAAGLSDRIARFAHRLLRRTVAKRRPLIQAAH